LSIELLRPARRGEAERAGSQLFKPCVLQRVLELTAAIWRNDHTDQPTMRAVTAYDH
jgi:hypothetical protein